MLVERRILIMNWAIVFLVIALTAAVLGFTGAAAATPGVPRVIFLLFAGLFALSRLTGFGKRA